jgi:hypothetical protein
MYEQTGHGYATVIFLTDFADQAVVLPLTLAIAVTLAVLGWTRGAAAWLAAAVTTFALVLVLKIVFIGCGSLLAPTGITSPSGHTAAAALLAGGTAALFTHRRSVIASSAIGAAIVIGTTRVLLGAHGLGEVVLGGLIGLGGALVLSALAGPPPMIRHVVLAVVGAAVIAGLHGTRLRAEDTIRETAFVIRTLLPSCEPVPRSWSYRGGEPSGGRANRCADTGRAPRDAG